jgi:hypothetical protein
MSEPRPEFVKVYDFKTKTVTTIPAAELAPGMVRIQLNGSKEVYWADASAIGEVTGRYWHPPFTGELKEKIVFIQRALSDVYFNTLEYWEDGFRQDLHAEQEIEQWFRVAMLYSTFADTHRLTREQKHEAFSVLGACLNGTRSTVFETAKLNSLPRVLAEELADDYFSYQ